MLKKVLVLSAALAVLVFTAKAALEEVQRRWAEPLAISPEGVYLTVEQGDSLRTVVASLNEAGVLPYPKAVVLYGRWTGADQKIQRGEYLLQPGLTVEALLQKLQDGDIVSYQVTLPEGITLQAAIDILAGQSDLESELEGAEDPRILELVQPHASPEGLFFPDTYQYVRGDSDWRILKRAHAAMQAVLEEEWSKRADELPYETAYEALIMASIVERETGLRAERGRIAGVFNRRLQRGMLLQTDPTVIYGLGADFDGNLQRKHLKQDDNPYNTYRHGGLPPSPIALAGRAAIHAALHPEAGRELYFVARGDGGHVFSETLAEHNQAVRQYQLQRRKDYRSSPVEPE